MLATEEADSVHDPMGGYCRLDAVAGIEGVAHGPRAASAAQKARNSPVGGDSSRGYQPDDLVNAFKKSGSIFLGMQSSWVLLYV